MTVPVHPAPTVILQLIPRQSNNAWVIEPAHTTRRSWTAARNAIRPFAREGIHQRYLCRGEYETSSPEGMMNTYSFHTDAHQPSSLSSKVTEQTQGR